jgi:serine/threonine protein kinase
MRKPASDEPWLSTQCGSESYAAPELLIAAHTDEQTLPALSRAPSDAHGGSAGSHLKSRTTARTPGTYDGHETDAWALGVVLFALVTRSLVFTIQLATSAHRRGGGACTQEVGTARRPWGAWPALQ